MYGSWCANFCYLRGKLHSQKFSPMKTNASTVNTQIEAILDLDDGHGQKEKHSCFQVYATITDWQPDDGVFNLNTFLSRHAAVCPNFFSEVVQ